MNQGDCFKDNLGDGIPHLHVIVFVVEVAQEALVVSVTSYNEEKDPTCILNVGDHPFIKHKSCISYRHATVTSYAVLNGLINTGKFVVHQSMPLPVMERIINGLCTSGEVVNKVRKWVKKYRLV
ncbi:MAG TPA: hypothetical protein PLI09_14430 [Candidatus Hydrogenedentes bacterium]|nr:hypothetical protein [Candidatus Hydrogenedentota bacterium]